MRFRVNYWEPAVLNRADWENQRLSERLRVNWKSIGARMRQFGEQINENCLEFRLSNPMVTIFRWSLFSQQIIKHTHGCWNKWKVIFSESNFKSLPLHNTSHIHETATTTHCVTWHENTVTMCQKYTYTHTCSWLSAHTSRNLTTSSVNLSLTLEWELVENLHYTLVVLYLS